MPLTILFLGHTHWSTVVLQSPSRSSPIGCNEEVCVKQCSAKHYYFAKVDYYFRMNANVKCEIIQGTEVSSELSIDLSLT